MRKIVEWEVARVNSSTLTCYPSASEVEPFTLALEDGLAPFAIAIIRTPTLVERLPVSGGCAADPERARSELEQFSLLARMGSLGLCPRPTYEVKGVPASLVPAEGTSASTSSLARRLRTRAHRRAAL